MRLICLLVAMGFGSTAAAAYRPVCEVERGQRECIDEAKLLKALTDSGHGDAAVSLKRVLGEVRRVGRAMSQDMVLVENGTFRIGRVNRQGVMWSTSSVLRPSYPATSYPTEAPPYHAQKDIGVTRTGDNTGGQILWGPPDSAAAFGCTGYLSVDTCKACCMASRTTMLAPIYAMAVSCHTWSGPCVWCHIGCGVAEAAMLAGLAWDVKACNNNCERDFFNDTSIDFPQEQRNRLESSEDFQECVGWGAWADGERVFRDAPHWDANILCTIDRSQGAGYDFSWDMNWIEIRAVGERGPRGMIVDDYRILDVSSWLPGNQIPYVGVTQVDGRGVFLALQTGGRLYIDMSWRASGIKIWAYGEVDGDLLDVYRLGIISF